jgi:periplasmic protein TonB
MSEQERADFYTAREIGLAAGVAEERVIHVLGGADRLVPHDEAVQIGRTLRQEAPPVPTGEPESLFGVFSANPSSTPRTGYPLVVSGALHAVAVSAGILLSTLGIASTTTTLASTLPPEPMRLVFLLTPGPGGGGGGGGRRESTPPPKAEREGRQALSSPLPARQPPPAVVPPPELPKPLPTPPLKAEPLPPIVAPIATASADTKDQTGVLERTRTTEDSHGPGSGGGAGQGRGTGLGEGDGPGVGPGTGGGTGGGPFRPGSGVEPPRLLSEVKPVYTDEARRQGVEGEVVMEIIVLSNGSVGSVKVLRGLPAGLNDRAVQAVRAWRFAPARLRGTPVDVVVEASVEFRMR